MKYAVTENYDFQHFTTDQTVTDAHYTNQMRLLHPIIFDFKPHVLQLKVNINTELMLPYTLAIFTLHYMVKMTQLAQIRSVTQTRGKKTHEIGCCQIRFRPLSYVGMIYVYNNAIVTHFDSVDNRCSSNHLHPALNNKDSSSFSSA